MKFEDQVALLRTQKHRGRDSDDFRHDVVLLAQGEPLPYLIGHVSFCNAHIDLSRRPMVPRPETENWVRQVVALHEHKQPRQVLDLFSGSGCVGLALAKQFRSARVTCIELLPHLKEQIDLSAEINHVADRVTTISGSIWGWVSGTYDVITAVPPYVPHPLKEEVMKELHAEDERFFFDKDDGFYFHTEVLSQAKNYLSENGVLYLEFDITQREKIEELAKGCGFTEYSFLKDPYGHECVIKLTK